MQCAAIIICVAAWPMRHGTANRFTTFEIKHSPMHVSPLLVRRRAATFVLLSTVAFAACNKKLVPVGQIQTPKGEILFALYNQTPNHRASFITMANAHYWDSFTFNRVIPNFVAQGGCPDVPEGFTDTAMLLPPEIVPQLKHVYGAVGAGRDDNPQMNSARCQFYIVQARAGLPRLDGKYTVFGKVFRGMDVVDSIVNMPRSKADEPLTPVPMRVRVLYLPKKQLR